MSIKGMKFRDLLLPAPSVELTEEGEREWLCYHLKHTVECMGLGAFHTLAIGGYSARLQDCFDRYHAGDFTGIVNWISLMLFITIVVKWQLFDLLGRYQADTQAILERYYYLPPYQMTRDEYDPFGDA